jgi:uncharacterized protein (DUF885 family)
MHRWTWFALVWIALLGMDGRAGAEEPDVDATFEQLSADFLERYLAEYPVSASGLGDHRRDGLWRDVSAGSRQRRAAWMRSVRSRLERIPAGDLDAENRVDAAILAHRLDASLFRMEELREWETNPRSAIGTAGTGLDVLVSRDFAPLPQRMASLLARLEGLPAFLEQSREGLGTAIRIHTETAIDQNRGLIGYVEGAMRRDFGQVPDQRVALDRAADAAAEALRMHLAFLEDEVLPQATEDFRLGPDLYARKLRYTLDTDMDPDTVVERAWELLDRTTGEMAVVAEALYPTLFPGKPRPETHGDAQAAVIREVLDRIAEERPTDETIVAEAQQTLAAATAFVAEHDLVTLPDEAVEVIEMPEFRRGVAIAYCDAPGPLEEVRQTFYAIAPPPADWPSERRESFYREYNRAMLVELSIHEAMPGHYLQLAHAARFDSAVRSVFGSGTFVEGWAVYSEWMMAEYGFGGAEVEMQQLKMVLRLCINAILDHGVHAGTMDHDAALALMTGRGFQEEGEAEGKWKRACLTSAQLSSYLVGFLEMMDLRKDYEARAGEAFDLKAYNDEVLSHGSPAPRHLRTLLGM